MTYVRQIIGAAEYVGPYAAIRLIVRRGAPACAKQRLDRYMRRKAEAARHPSETREARVDPFYRFVELVDLANPLKAWRARPKSDRIPEDSHAIARQSNERPRGRHSASIHLLRCSGNVLRRPVESAAQCSEADLQVTRCELVPGHAVTAPRPTRRSLSSRLLPLVQPQQC